MDALLPSIIAIASAVITSSGFWAYLNKRDTQRGAQTRLLLGLAHDRIIFLGMSYIERGYITKDEYDDFLKYLYEPYATFGGNGLAERIKDEVSRLPIRGRTVVRVESSHHD